MTLFEWLLIIALCGEVGAFMFKQGSMGDHI